jgi:hypothetical protein
MKGSIFLSVSAVLVVMIVLVAGAQAQTPYALRGSIPFSFTAGNEFLPSGDYLFKPYDRNYLLIQGLDNGKSAFIPTMSSSRVVPVRGPAGGQIIFHQYEGVYFLSKVMNKSEYCDRRLPVTKSEKEAEKNSSSPEINTIAALATRIR